MKQPLGRVRFAQPLIFYAGRAAAALIFWALVLGAILVTTPVRAQHGGAMIGPATGSVPGIDPGELLLGELNCVACHEAEEGTKARLASRQAPRLGDGGLRVTPQFLRAFLANPSAEQPGTLMPDVLPLDATQRAGAVDALVHFLSSIASSDESLAVSADQSFISRGRLLYHQVGCVACHAPQAPAAVFASNTITFASQEEAPPAHSQPLGGGGLDEASVPLGKLARKTSVSDLARFLINPLTSHPSGRMPSLSLTEPEATAIAMYLLREQASATNAPQPLRPTPGLAYDYCEGTFRTTAALEAAKPKASGMIERISLQPPRRSDYYGFRFNGLVKIPANGTYTFYTLSDDGSRLYLDGKLVVDNDGYHGATEKSGSIDLTAGEHPFSLFYFNLDGGEALKVSYQGPGLPKQEIPARAFSHLAVPMVPIDEEKLTVDPQKVRRGEQMFSSLGCASCHQLGSIPSTLAAKSLLNLDPNAKIGCLARTPGRAPRYELTDAQREALRSTLTARESLSRFLPPQEQVKRTMSALNCFACHTRDGIGGPVPARSDYFTVIGQADLGDEGRLPPHLTRVGDKLKPEWLREVLLNKGTARPYMATRMPQFGKANVEPLLDAFAKADARPGQQSEDAVPPSQTLPARDVNYGRKLVGTEGLSCISCHVFAGHKSLGIPAMDLTLMTRRVKKDWFHRYLLDPPSLRPGTRMPAFWPEGKSSRQDILGGDSDRQIGAVWAYLSLGKEAGLPAGLIQGKMELVASNEALIYRHFIQGAGTRAIAVGYPEKANLAFDAHELRLALLWQGPFIDAAKHRSGRGDGFGNPLGYNILKMPSGAPFAMLGDPSTKWPEKTGQNAGYHMRGYRLDSTRRPVFQYSFEGLQIEDYPVAISGDVEASIKRTLTLQADHPTTGLWFRAWVGTKIEPQKDGSFLADGKISLAFQLADEAKPLVRQSEGKTELLVPVLFNNGRATIAEQIVW